MYLRLEEARTLGAQYRRERGYGKTASSILVEKAHFSESKTYDVFLSHSYDDAEVILGVYRFIESQGKTVYVDWIEDKGLDRSNVTAATAEVLRHRMRSSTTFVYASSNNATKSKWMPWELGYFDGFRPGMVSILPLVEASDSEWKGQEYLGLYPVVNRLEYAGSTLPFVVKNNSAAQTFSDFGKSSSFIWRNIAGRATL